MDPLACANLNQPPDDPPCPNIGTKACSNCRLVLYCSKECQQEHWPVHRKDCRHVFRDPNWRPAWERDGRVPAFLTDSVASHTDGEPFGGGRKLWGDVPAIDVLALDGNEGASWEEEVKVLFAASGDLRNLVKTVVSLPEGFTGRLTVDINDEDEIVVARNLLLLLLAMSCNPENAAALMLHLWYSAFLSPDIFQGLVNTIVPLIEAAISLNPKEEGCELADDSEIVQVKWKRNDALLTATLPREDWNAISALFPSTPVNQGRVAIGEANTLRLSVTLAPSRRDYRERAMFRLPPSWRLATFRFRGMGVLLPYATSCDGFDIPNPTFFTDNLMFPLFDTDNPLNGWSLSEVIGSSTWNAKDDIYGHLYHYLTRMFEEFSRRLCKMDININLVKTIPSQLPEHLASIREGESPGPYDRIDLSTLAEPSQLGPELALIIFSPLLRSKQENPHAVLITLFPDPCPPDVDSDSSSDTIGPDDYQKPPRLPPNPILKFTMTLSQPLINKIHSTYLPITQSIILNTYMGGHNADLINFMGAHDLFLDREGPFKEFIEWCDPGAAARVMRVGMKAREDQSVVPRWALGLDEEPTKCEFEWLFWSGHTGKECWIEWARAWDDEDLLLAMANLAL